MSSYHKIWDGLSGTGNKSINYISVTGLKRTIPKEQVIYDDKPKTSIMTHCKTSAIRDQDNICKLMAFQGCCLTNISGAQKGKSQKVRSPTGNVLGAAAKI